MTRGGGGGHPQMFDDFIDDLILSRVLPVKEAAALTQEQLDVLRAHVRSEILYSDRVREALTERATQVLNELRS